MTLVAGEAGVGKSRLVAEFEQRAHRSARWSCTARCIELDGGELPYAAMAAALRDVPPEALAAAMADLPAHGCRALAGAFPQLAVDDEPLNDARRRRPLLAGSALRVPVRLPARAGLGVSGRSSWSRTRTGSIAPRRELMLFLTRNLRRERIAMVITYRTDELDRAHPTRRLLGDLRRIPSVTCIELDGLNRNEMREMLGEILGRRPD